VTTLTQLADPKALVEVGKPLPGALRIYGLVTESNRRAGEWLVMAYAADALRRKWDKLSPDDWRNSLFTGARPYRPLLPG
jgi:hypothetical protein